MTTLVRKAVKPFAAIAVFTLVAVVSSISFVRSAYIGAALEVCALIENHYYRRDEPEVREFLADCRAGAKRQKFLLSKEMNARRINKRLAALGVSHLSLYSPAEDQLLWDNHGLDTGLRARRIEDKLVIYRVLPESAGQAEGAKIGDAVLAIGGEEPSTAWEVQSGSGQFVIERAGKKIGLEILPTEISEDLSPRLVELSRGVGHLVLGSFLPQYFDKESWLSLASKLGRYSRLIIDLRGNAGGSFPAMLRALAPFRCGGGEVGVIRQAAKPGLVGSTDLADVLDAQEQLRQLGEAQSVRLLAFKGYGCYNGPVTVLIDSETSSTAEIFAHSFFSRPESRVWGQTSAGRVVMAQWFTLRGFGEPAYTLSIPIAGFFAPNGTEIEGVGVTPERELHYELEAALDGRDSWLEACLGVSD